MSKTLYFDLDRLHLNNPCDNGLIRLQRSIGRVTGKIPVTTALRLLKTADILYSDFLWGLKVLEDPAEVIRRWAPVIGDCDGLETMKPRHCVFWLHQTLRELLNTRTNVLFQEWISQHGPSWVNMDVPEFAVQVEKEVIRELMEWCR